MADEADELPEIIDAPPPAADPAPEAPKEPVEAPAEVAEGDDPPEPRKDPVAQLKGRVGHLTKSLHEKDAEIARLKAGMTSEAPTSDAVAAAKEQVKAEAAQAAFDAECNEVFDKGKAEFADEFAESITALNATGIMQRPMIEAALATGDAAKVLHYLGQDLDAATRIAEMHPIKMAAEMTKLAVKLAGTKARTSNAPAPIKPLGGTTKGEPDIYDPDLDDETYYARRKKQGNAPWLQ